MLDAFYNTEYVIKGHAKNTMRNLHGQTKIGR